MRFPNNSLYPPAKFRTLSVKLLPCTFRNDIISICNFSNMPKVIGHTPPWLSRPSLGARIFTDSAPQSPESPSKRSSYLGSPPSVDYQGPRRLVASRGTEIFTVVGNKIRWADLASIRDEWEEGAHSGNSRHGLTRAGGDDAGEQAYRVCGRKIISATKVDHA